MQTAEVFTIGALAGFILGTIYRDVVAGFYHKEVAALRGEFKTFSDFVTRKLPK
jgi:hypothetical protein